MTLTARSYTSGHLMEYTALLIGKVRAIEVAHSELPPHDMEAEHRALAISVVMLSAAFLDAVLNELFADIASGQALVSHPAVASHRTALEAVGRRRLPLLDRYDAALAASGHAPFDHAVEPFQTTKLAIYLRNSFVHAEPYEASSEDLGPKKMERKLRNRFALNPWHGTGTVFFPHRVLSAGCGRWLLTAFIAHADEFFHRLGVPPPYESRRRAVSAAIATS